MTARTGAAPARAGADRGPARSARPARDGWRLRRRSRELVADLSSPPGERIPSPRGDDSASRWRAGTGAVRDSAPTSSACLSARGGRPERPPCSFQPANEPPPRERNAQPRVRASSWGPALRPALDGAPARSRTWLQTSTIYPRRSSQPRPGGRRATARSRSARHSDARLGAAPFLATITTLRRATNRFIGLSSIAPKRRCQPLFADARATAGARTAADDGITMDAGPGAAPHAPIGCRHDRHRQGDSAASSAPRHDGANERTCSDVILRLRQACRAQPI